MTVSRPAPGIVLLFIALVVDGFDTAVLGVAVPSIAVEWRLASSDFTLPLVMTAVGAIIGYLISAPLTRRWGEATIVWASLLFFGLAMPAAAYTAGIGQLSAVRLITGIGLGTVLPAAVSLAGDLRPQRPQSAAMFLVLGLVTGNVLAGILSGPLISAFGWRSLFLIGSALALITAALIAAWMRTDAPPGRERELPPAVDRTDVRLLLSRRTGTSTAALWLAALLVSACFQLLQAWLPSFAAERGIAVERVPLALAAMTVGGLAGGAVVACLGSARRTSFGLITLLSLAGVAMAISPVTGASVPGAALTLGVVGAGLVAGGAGVAGIAVTLYPRHLRTLGVGFAASATRLGAIAGPAVGGAVLQASSPATTLAAMAIPALVSAVLFVGITRRTASAPPPPSTHRAPLTGADHGPHL